jgi:hypothetical protein
MFSIVKFVVSQWSFLVNFTLFAEYRLVTLCFYLWALVSILCGLLFLCFSEFFPSCFPDLEGLHLLSTAGSFQIFLLVACFLKWCNCLSDSFLLIVLTIMDQNHELINRHWSGRSLDKLRISYFFIGFKSIMVACWPLYSRSFSDMRLWILRGKQYIDKFIK